ncbi:hypothetical protein [Acinetobacter nosocomialis]|uniref:hypothetical protein n=1 Tax=Acinetobacter nosocomialis TaxID=106654 RepID=UPI001B8327A9|nr:hypothetical protein [Acinetobacter nosocomialis]MBR7715687.1 hypothetical protein [Acinetobacter nosocomialis]MDO7211689.1 hypothetical protein [Acinetobacter nosocomialis]
MNSWRNEHNERQYNLMLDMIFEFKKEKIGIKQLILSLKSLCNTLESVPESWKNSFNEEWFTLETVYALALDRQEESLDKKFILTSEEINIINNTLVNLQNLISERKAK